MPVEGQQKLPLRPRDKRFLGVLAAVAVTASGVGAYLHFSRDSSAANCVTVTVASTMCGATIHRCGADAVQFCRQNGPNDASVAAACRREGF